LSEPIFLGPCVFLTISATDKKGFLFVGPVCLSVLCVLCLSCPFGVTETGDFAVASTFFSVRAACLHVAACVFLHLLYLLACCVQPLCMSCITRCRICFPMLSTCVFASLLSTLIATTAYVVCSSCEPTSFRQSSNHPFPVLLR